MYGWQVHARPAASRAPLARGCIRPRSPFHPRGGGGSSALGVHWRPPSILGRAQTRFGAIVNAQAGPLVVGVGGTERSCDARAPAAARRLGPARSADPCPPVRPARESALRRLVQGARPRQRRGHVRGGAGDAGAQRVAPWLTRIATVPTWAAASRPASNIARLDSGESPTGTRIVPEVHHAIRRGPPSWLIDEPRHNRVRTRRPGTRAPSRDVPGKANAAAVANTCDDIRHDLIRHALRARRRGRVAPGPAPGCGGSFPSWPPASRDCRIDLHSVLDLIDRDGPPALAARILAPLEDDPRPC